MKNRIAILEAQLQEAEPKNQADELIELGKKWQKAVAKRDWKAAEKASEKAQSYFKKHPEWKLKPPKWFGNKMLFIDWVCFTCFNQSKMQEEYKRAILEGVAPGYSSLNTGR
jgi:hypothetical protein